MRGLGRQEEEEVGGIGGTTQEQIVFFSYVKHKHQTILYCRLRMRFLFKALKKTTYGALISDRIIGLINIILNTALRFSIQFFRILESLQGCFAHTKIFSLFTDGSLNVLAPS